MNNNDLKNEKSLNVPKIFNKNNVLKPFVNATGEHIFELSGAAIEQGEARNHSFAYVEIIPGGSSRLHYHPVAEETYYILEGKGKIFLDEKENDIGPHDCILVSPMVKHQIFASKDEPLKFIVSCAPVWEPTNSVFLDEE